MTTLHLLTLGFLLACNASGSQTQHDGDSMPAPQAPIPGADQERRPPRGEAWVIFQGDTVVAEVARTAEEREQGLMYRETLAEGRGMLFVFPDAQVRSFWMKNTLLPLDIAYIDENLTIVDIQAMAPQSEDAHTSAGPAMFALEVPQGWFEAAGIDVGARARVVFGPG
jgi:hypothetical protein